MPPEPRPNSVDTCLPCEGETIIALSSDESDEEVESDHVYTLLGQQEPADDESSSEDEESNPEVRSAPDLDVSISAVPEEAQPETEPSSPRPSGSEDIAAVWNSQPPPSTSLDLNAERAAQIQAAMAGFTLPPSAVPAWAVNVPEEQWKQGLLERLQRGAFHTLKAGANSGSKNT